jgi:hypothetical protein
LRRFSVLKREEGMAMEIKSVKNEKKPPKKSSLRGLRVSVLNRFGFVKRKILSVHRIDSSFAPLRVIRGSQKVKILKNSPQKNFASSRLCEKPINRFPVVGWALPTRSRWNPWYWRNLIREFIVL